jgi:hypothetical protein
VRAIFRETAVPASKTQLCFTCAHPRPISSSPLLLREQAPASPCATTDPSPASARARRRRGRHRSLSPRPALSQAPRRRRRAPTPSTATASSRDVALAATPSTADALDRDGPRRGDFVAPRRRRGARSPPRSIGACCNALSTGSSASTTAGCRRCSTKWWRRRSRNKIEKYSGKDREPKS